MKNVVTQYVKDSFQELNKVTWPTKNQAVRLTGIVLGFTITAALFIAAVDYLLTILNGLALKSLI